MKFLSFVSLSSSFLQCHFHTSLSFSHHLSGAYLNRNITSFWSCSDVNLCHFMVIFTCHIHTLSACLHCDFWPHASEEYHPSVALTIKITDIMFFFSVFLLVLNSITSHISSKKMLSGERKSPQSFATYRSKLTDMNLRLRAAVTAINYASLSVMIHHE